MKPNFGFLETSVLLKRLALLTAHCAHCRQLVATAAVPLAQPVELVLTSVGVQASNSALSTPVRPPVPAPFDPIGAIDRPP